MRAFAQRRRVAPSRVQRRVWGTAVLQARSAGWSMPHRADKSAKVKPAVSRAASTKRIKNLDAGLLKMARVPRGDSQAMFQSGGGDHGVQHGQCLTLFP